MPSTRPCEECGVELPANAPQGLCPRCLVGMGLKLAPLVTVEGPLPEPAVDRIGRYTIVEKLGEGGCGTVYLAEQEEPVRRQVALKVIKPGMDTRQVIARFEAERQTLALMDHPLVAKVFDAGATDAGRPYFVMELVRGARITDYCDQQQLGTRDRLRLFIQVCQAIQHAHQKGIIHRDLKPSNVLVAEHEGVATPRVIDFGIAKATQQRLSDETLTESHLFLGTPAYMSPEQASGVDIDTRSDIYSLGVLLYELLTGRLPFDREELCRAGFEELCRRIREQEPPRPSMRLSALSQADLTVLALRRQTEPAKLATQVRGDLDWIVMKAIEKDRARRYESAVALAEDVQRHLDHQPVVACPPTRLYQFKKFARRHRAAFAAASGMAAMLVVGSIVSTWQALRATRAEREQRLLAQKAERAREKELKAREKRDQVASFLEEMLKGVGPSVALGRDTKMLREILDKTAERLGKELKGQPDVEADLRSTIGQVYKELALYEPAEAMHREALRLRRAVFGPEHETVAESLNQLAGVLQAREKTAEAVSRYRESLAMHRRLYGAEHHRIVAALNNLGNALSFRDAPAAEETLREALALSRKIRAETDAGSPNVLYSLGLVLKQRGKTDEAERMLHESLTLRRTLLNGLHPDIAATLNALGDLYRENGRLAAAETNLVEALAMLRKLHRDEAHPAVATALGNLALLLDRRGKHPEAEAMCVESLETYRKIHGEDHLKVATSLNNLALIQSHRRDLSAAESTYHQALALRKKLLGDEHPTHAVLLNNLGTVQRRLRKFAEARASFLEAIEMGKKFPGDADRDLALSLGYLAAVLRDQEDLDGAEKLLQEAVAIRKRLSPLVHPETAQALNDLAMVQYRRGELAECEDNQREAVSIQMRLGGEHADVAICLGNLARVLHRREKLGEAETAASNAVTLWRKLRGDTASSDLASAHRTLGLILTDGRKFTEAEAAFTEEVALRRKLEGEAPAALAGALNSLGSSLRQRGQLEAAVAKHREAVALFEGRKPEVALANSLGFLGLALRQFGRPDEAEAVHQQELVLRKQLLGERHPDVALSLRRIAEGRWSRRDLAGAEPMLVGALAILRQAWTNNPVKVEEGVLNLAELLYQERKFADAEPLFRELLQSRGKRLPPENDETMDATIRLATLLTEWAWQERTAAGAAAAQHAHEAERLLGECLSVRTRTLDPSSSRLADTKGRLGDAGLAVALTDSDFDAALRKAKFAEIEPLLLESSAVLQKSPTTDPRLRRDAVEWLARLYEAWDADAPGTGKADQAARWRQALAEFERPATERQPKPSDHGPDGQPGKE